MSIQKMRILNYDFNMDSIKGLEASVLTATAHEATIEHIRKFLEKESDGAFVLSYELASEIKERYFENGLPLICDDDGYNEL